VFGVVLITVITILHLYVFLRASSVPFVKRLISAKVLVGSAMILWAIFATGRLYGHGKAGILAQVLEWLGMTWMAVVFLIFISLFVVDLLTGFGMFIRKRVTVFRGWALILGLVLSVVALIQGLRQPVVRQYEVTVPDLPAALNGTVIVAVSDMHLGQLVGRKWLEKRIEQIRDQKPDLVLLIGDIFEGHGVPKDELLVPFHKLSAPLGVWAVPGNHEFHGRLDTGVGSIEKAGFQVLHNTWTKLRRGLVLAGVDDLTVLSRSGRDDEVIKKTLADIPPGAAILLSHTPWQSEQAARAGVDLMLSGHTHGGQIWPFGYLVQMRYPLLAGRYDVHGMTVIVSRGAGTWGPRMRLWYPGEILRITLKKKI